MVSSTHCQGCNKEFAKTGPKSKTGYCGNCFHDNVDGIKSEYNAARWADGTSKKHHWKHRGVIISEKEIDRHNNTEVCDFCGNTIFGSKQLDHCHETGKYRGTLCRECNTGLGKLGDDLDLILERVISYKKFADKVKW
jgi:hypothetical protein